MCWPGSSRAYDKPGAQIDESALLEVERPPRFVSRGGEKLAHALEAFAVDPAAATASTSAPRPEASLIACSRQERRAVIAIDVGYGQLHPRLRADPRVTVLERTNVRELTALPFAPSSSSATSRSSRYGRRCRRRSHWRAPGWEALVLVKPQFEAGRADAPKGVVRDPEVHRNTLKTVSEAAAGWGGTLVGVVDSGLPGPKGNREFFFHLVNRPTPTLPDDIDRWIDDAVG